MKLLEVSGLKKYYLINRGWFSPRQYVRAVDDVSFSLDAGETLGLVGESGCGKSTLARTLLRLEEPTSGSILLNGVNLCDIHGEKLRKMRGRFQMIFQDPYSSLNPRMRIFSILEEALKLHTSLTKGEISDKIADLLRVVGLN